MPRYSLRVGSKRVPLATTDTALSKAVGKRLASSQPETNVDSAGASTSYTFNGQEIGWEELRDIKSIREDGGQVAQLMTSKALLNFGEGAEFGVEDNEETEQLVDGEPMTLQDWLEDAFPHIDLLVLDLGEDALWYPYAVGETIETRGGGFDEALPAEPWTLLPETDARGRVVGWHQRTKDPSGGYTEQRLGAEDVWHIVLNKSSARDETGISEVLRSQDEIQAFKENEAAINNAIELHGFPQRHVKVGEEDGAPVRDDDLRRVRTVFDPRTSDANTAYFTGQDVDVDTLEAQNFEFSKIHEMDMRNLTTALGLPLEAGNVGSDGLGSGKPAELRFALLKLAIKANQRSFSTQFVEQVVRPVVKRHSPFDATERISLRIDDPLEDIGETAELIQKVGDYMTNEEIRERLDMPAPEDDEIAEGYRSPADMEAPEDEGGPFGGGEGLFSHPADGRDLQTPEGVPSNAVSISDRSEAPEGASVVQGPGGGLYYVPGGEGDDDAGQQAVDEIRDEIDSIVDSVDLTDTVETETGDVTLSRDTQEELRNAIAEEFGEEATDTVFDNIGRWKDNSYSDSGQRLEKAFAAAVGTDENIRNDELDGGEPTDDEIAAAGAMIGASREFLRENYGDSLDLKRGLSDFGTGQLLAEWLNNPDDESVEFSLSAMSNFTTYDAVADRFAGDRAKFETEVSTDDVLLASDFIHGSEGVDEGEIAIEGQDRSADLEDINVFNDLLPLSPDDMNDEQLSGMVDILDEQGDTMLENLDETGQENLRTALSEYEGEIPDAVADAI